jgi:hypothetical protein
MNPVSYPRPGSFAGSMSERAAFSVTKEDMDG